MLGLDRYLAAQQRYSQMQYRRCGHSGLDLPVISLGLWHNFGDTTPIATQRQILRAAFDRGITHFDLANNYGPPAGSAEINFGRLLREDFLPYRDELVLSTKAGYDMWPGPYGEWGSRKYLMTSLEQSLRRMGLEAVDIFYSHRFDPNTPLEETMGALADIQRQGKALYVGLSSYSPQKTREATELLRAMGVRGLIHQPSYSILNRWIEPQLLDTLQSVGMGCIAFSPLAQGLLSDKYLGQIPADARINKAGGGSLRQSHLSPENLQRVRGLSALAQARGQTLPQMALAWCLRRPEVTSVLIGVSSVAQLDENIAALNNLAFSTDELAQIDRFAQEGGINLWQASSQAE